MGVVFGVSCTRIFLSLQFAGMSTEVCPLPDASNLMAASHIQFDQVMADLIQLERDVKGMWEDREVCGRRGRCVGGEGGVGREGGMWEERGEGGVWEEREGVWERGRCVGGRCVGGEGGVREESKVFGRGGRCVGREGGMWEERGEGGVWEERGEGGV